MNEYRIVESVLKEKTNLGEVKRKELAYAIIDALDDNGLLTGDFTAVDAVDVVGAKIPVEYVTMFGLEISVDANGNAVEVSSPHGFLIT